MSEVKTPANPSRKAMARVKNPLPTPTECRFCHSEVRVATHQEVYGRDYSDGLICIYAVIAVPVWVCIPSPIYRCRRYEGVERLPHLHAQGV